MLLITCVDARRKYLDGLGDLGVFDAIVDITELVTRRTQYGFRPSFFDRVEDVIFADDTATLANILSARAPRRAVLFSPRRDLEKLAPVVNLIKSFGVECDLAINRHSAHNLIPLPRTRWLARRLNCWLRGDLRLRVDCLYYSDDIFLPQFADIVTAERLKKVRHIDAPRFGSWSGGYNVFLDSCFPFHKEFIAAGGPLSPENFYNRLRDFIVWLQSHESTNRFIIALHPSSEKKEVPYLHGIEWRYGETNELIAGADKVWAFGSDAAGTAVCYGKPVEYLNFPDLLPPYMQDYIEKKGRRMGIPVVNFDGEIVRKEDVSLVGRLFRRRWYRRTFGQGFPFLSDAIALR
ncbi:MAG: hypothetical protein ACNA8G_03110 [Gammaproteobacteria bacterium]